MLTTYIPQPLDEALRMETALNKTASGSGTSLDQGALYNPGGVGQPMGIVCSITTLDTTTGDETYKLTMEESDDDSSYSDCGPIITVTATGMVTVPGFVSKRYIRLKETLAGTTPILTLDAWATPLVTP